MLTFKRINLAIKQAGIPLTLTGTHGDGYFYFLDSKGDQVGDNVMVARLNHQALESWVDDAQAAYDSIPHKIVRYYHPNHPDSDKAGTSEVIKCGLTLAEAQEHCSDQSTHGEWYFDGYRKEE